MLRSDFWQYFELIRQNMPANCSADVEATITHIDRTLASNNQTQIQALKDSFGMGDLSHSDDFVSARQLFDYMRYYCLYTNSDDMAPVREILFDWQGIQPDGELSNFIYFCDQLEVKNGEVAPAAGWGVDHALPTWASFWKTKYLHVRTYKSLLTIAV